MEIIHNHVSEKIRTFTDTILWEQLCCDILSRLGYRGIEPQSLGGKDGGKDAIVHTCQGNIACHFSLRKDYETKLFEDLEKTKNKGFKIVVFCTNQLIPGTKKDSLKKKVKIQYKQTLDLYDREKLRVEIENHRPDLLPKLGLNHLQEFIKNADLYSVPILDDQSKARDILTKYLNLNMEEGNQIEVFNKNGIPQLKVLNQSLTKIPNNIYIKTKTNAKFQNIIEYINNKTKNGEDIIITEDEIIDFKIEPSIENIPDVLPKTIIISPTPLKEPIFIDIEILGSDIRYNNIKVAPVQINKEFSILRSFDSNIMFWFKFNFSKIANWNKIIKLDDYDPKKVSSLKTDFKVSLNEECVDLDEVIKFNKFLRDLTEKKLIVMKYSNNKELISRSRVEISENFDEHWLKLLELLHEISIFFNIQFEAPRSLDSSEIRLINKIHSAIKEKKLEVNFEDIVLNINKDFVDTIISDYAGKQHIVGLKMDVGNIKVTLLGKEINFGKGIAQLPPLKLGDSIDSIRKKLKSKSETQSLPIRFIPFEDVNHYEMDLPEIEDFF